MRKRVAIVILAVPLLTSAVGGVFIYNNHKQAANNIKVVQSPIVEEQSPSEKRPRR